MRRSVLCLALILAGCGGDGGRVLVAAGTTLVDSGMVDLIVEAYESETGGDVSVVADATARVLELGRRGGAEVLLTHDAEQETAFVGEGLAAEYRPVIVTSFLLIGPAERAGSLDGLEPAQAFGEIAAAGWPFVGRDDGSGTHSAELALWAAAAFDPEGEPWYDVTGQGMGLTLQVADQRSAFTLAEEASFLSARDTISLVPVAMAGTVPNPYHATLVAGASPEAAAFFEWLVGDAGTEAITAANFALFGEVVFHPG